MTDRDDPYDGPMSDAAIAALRDRLLAERAALLGAEDRTAEDRAPVELDQQAVGRLSRMDALQVQAMAAAQSRRRAARLRMIDAALTRITAGEFGWCERCGEAIDTRRLELDPAAPLCLDCARG